MYGLSAKLCWGLENKRGYGFFLNMSLTVFYVLVMVLVASMFLSRKLCCEARVRSHTFNSDWVVIFSHL